MVNRDVAVAQAIKQFIDAPYALGDTRKGWDCLSLLWAFYGALGVELPREFKGFSADNYAERWEGGEGRHEFYEYLISIGEEVEPNYAISGDLMIFDYNELVAPGIYLGNGHVLCVYEKGVYCLPLRFLRAYLYEVRRCLP